MRAPRNYCDLCDARVAKDAIALYLESELTAHQVAVQLGVPHGLVYKHLREAREAEHSLEARVARMYKDDELSVVDIARQVKKGHAWVTGVLRAAGIDIRKGGPPLSPLATRASLGELRRAVRYRPREKTRPRNCSRSEGLTQKQADILEIVRAAPEPLRTESIKPVLRELSRGRDYVDWTDVYYPLRRLEGKGFVSKVPGEGPQKVWFWFAAGETPAEPLTADQARREIEIRRLIEDQKADESRGSGVKWSGALSLDAPRTDDGFSLLESLGTEDEAIADLMEAI